MDLTKFYDEVEAHEDLEGIGQDNTGEGVLFYIRHIPTKTLSRIPAHCVLDHEWADLEDVLCLRRDACVLSHMSRVVGYFSRVENWNKSKVGELKDRQQGNYALAQ